MLPAKFANLHTFLLCNAHIQTKEELTAIALLIYAIYNATNHFRRHPPTNTADVYEAVTQWLREGAKNHPTATRTLDERWNPQRRDTPLPPIPSHI